MLDSKQCEAFLAVVEGGSFEQAGLNLYLTASAVTLRVQALEKNLGQLLLIRGKPNVLTQAGQKLFEHLQHTRRLEQNFLHHLTRDTHTHFYKTIIASNADSLATWLLPALKDVLIEEKILIEIHIDDQAHTYPLLEKGTVNACISIEDQPMRGCEAKYLGSMHYKMIATEQFKAKWFAQGINRQSLRTAPAIIFNEKDDVHFNKLEKMYGLTKRTYPHYLIPSSESFINAIALGLGYGFAPNFQIQALNQHKPTLIELLPEASIDIPLYWHHWQQQTLPLQVLTEHLIKNARRILTEAV